MAVTLIGSSSYSPPATGGSLASRTFAAPASAVGDAIFVEIVIASGSQTASVTGGGSDGWTLLLDTTFSGHHHYVFWKIAQAADNGATLTITTTSAIRATAAAVVIRGQVGSSIVDASAAVNGAAGGSTSIVSPLITTVASATQEFQFIAATGQAGTTGFTAPAGLTKIIEAVDPAAGIGGTTALVVGWNTVQQATGATPGGDTWSITPSTAGVLMSAITVSIKVAVAASSSRVKAVTASTGWAVVSAASILAALNDELDSSYAETADNPVSGTILSKSLNEVTTGPVTVKEVLSVSASSPAIQCYLRLRQGATVIATGATFSPTTTPTEYTLTTNSTQTGNITDRTNLFTDVVVA